MKSNMGIIIAEGTVETSLKFICVISQEVRSEGVGPIDCEWGCILRLFQYFRGITFVRIIALFTKTA